MVSIPITTLSGKEKSVQDQIKRYQKKLKEARQKGKKKQVELYEYEINRLEDLTKKSGRPKGTVKGDSGFKTSEELDEIRRLQEEKEKKRRGSHPFQQFSAGLWNPRKRKPIKDWTKDYLEMWKPTGDKEEDAWQAEQLFKHGGRIKKTKKKSKKRKRAALRGHRSELRGG